jgi:hypothetical protein
MRTVEANEANTSDRPARLWMIETLVVLGVLGFGYFAVTMDASIFGIAGPPAASTDLLTELLR